MAKQYEMTRFRRFGNALLKPLIRLGVVPGTYLLTTKGRKSGRLRTTPVQIIDDGDERWLVAPYGAVSWVHNVRALPRITLQKGRHKEELEVVEASPEDAAPVLQTYLQEVSIVRPYFDVTPDSPEEDFIAEAPRHPVCRIVEPGAGQPSTS